MHDSAEVSVRILERGERSVRVQGVTGPAVVVSLATADIEPDPHSPEGWYLLTMPRSLATEAGLA